MPFHLELLRCLFVVKFEQVAGDRKNPAGCRPLSAAKEKSPPRKEISTGPLSAAKEKSLLSAVSWRSMDATVREREVSTVRCPMSDADGQ